MPKSLRSSRIPKKLGNATTSRAVQRTPRNKEKLLSSKVVYRGPVFTVSTDHVHEPNGIIARRDVIHHSGSIVILAASGTQSAPQVLLERQYRHAANDYLWELPAGRIDPGEHEVHAAKRELLEETGYTAKHWRPILRFYASPGFVAETMSVYLATGLRAGQAQPEADEIIQIHFVPLAKAVEMAVGGAIRDAKTISSILWLSHQLARGKIKIA
jgi:ADP-ribose pyrophosphatase